MAVSTYCTEADIIAAYGSAFWLNVADDDGGGTADGVAQAIEWASGRIDGYVGVKYALPLETIPLQLREVAVDLSIYRRATTADRATEEIRNRMEDAIIYLKEIRNGEASLGLENPPVSLVDGLNLYSNDRVFTKSGWDLS